MAAAQNGHLPTVRHLLAKGAFVHAAEKDGETALMLAAGRGHAEVVHALIQKGAAVNIRDIAGFAPLRLAAYGGHLGVVELLLKAGAFVNTMGPLNGKTALDVAEREGHVEVAKLLERWGGSRSVEPRGDEGFRGEQSQASTVLGGAPAALPSDWKQVRARQCASLGPLRDVPLIALAVPQFATYPVTTGMPPAARREDIKRLVPRATLYRLAEDWRRLESATAGLPEEYPTFATGYCWRAYALAGLGRYQEALLLLEAGMLECPNAMEIADGIAYAFELMGDIRQFGWYMQACALGSRAAWGLLVLGLAAGNCGLRDLAARLDACAQWEAYAQSGGGHEADEKEVVRIRRVVSSDRQTLSTALLRFEQKIVPTLAP